ncbi:hypothetical protein ABDK00_001630 [Niabella insulamsoli]|uniref:hypothetical protein n=1 Tax=Niabella insulamsoli TaxID=3144874 RepID=UPI0031FCCC82
MSKSTSKNKANPAPVLPPDIKEEGIDSYDEQVNLRIDNKLPEGGTPPESPTGEPGTTESQDDNDGDQGANTPEGDTPPEDQLSEKLLGKLSAYKEAYPENEVFHITSDGQVFLDSGKSDAINHEKTLGGKLKSYSV